MYTNPSNIIKTLILMLERNLDTIDEVVHYYVGSDLALNVFEGIRPTLPQNLYPALEMEATSGSNQWATTRAQRPRYSFRFVLTVTCQDEEIAAEYITTMATCVADLLCDPKNLQLEVINECRWTPTDGLVQTRILDSLAEDVSYSASRDGTIRVAEFSYFALVHEPFPESKWRVTTIGLDSPSIVLPKVVEVL